MTCWLSVFFWPVFNQSLQLWCLYHPRILGFWNTLIRIIQYDNFAGLCVYTIHCSRVSIFNTSIWSMLPPLDSEKIKHQGLNPIWLLSQQIFTWFLFLYTFPASFSYWVYSPVQRSKFFISGWFLEIFITFVTIRTQAVFLLPCFQQLHCTFFVASHHLKNRSCLDQFSMGVIHLEREYNENHFYFGAWVLPGGELFIRYTTIACEKQIKTNYNI